MGGDGGRDGAFQCSLELEGLCRLIVGASSGIGRIFFSPGKLGLVTLWPQGWEGL